MGIFDRFYYGKAGKADYTERDMPKTRTALFFLVLRDHFFDLVKVNLLQVIFWLPFLIWTGLSFMVAQTFASAENPDFSQVSGTLLTWLVGLVPCIAVTGPSSAGSAYVMRNWAKDQHAFLFSDFWDALKANWKQALPVSALTGLVPLVIFAAVRFYGGMAGRSPAMYVPLVASLSLGLLFALMLPLIYPMIVGYQLSLRDILKNAALMAAAQLPRMILARLLTFLPIAAMLAGLSLGQPIAVLIVSLYYVVFGFAFSRLLYASVANGVFDLYLNPRIEGAKVREGLRPASPEEEWDEEDEEDEAEEVDGELP